MFRPRQSTRHESQQPAAPLFMAPSRNRLRARSYQQSSDSTALLALLGRLGHRQGKGFDVAGSVVAKYPVSAKSPLLGHALWFGESSLVRVDIERPGCPKRAAGIPDSQRMRWMEGGWGQ